MSRISEILDTLTDDLRRLSSTEDMSPSYDRAEAAINAYIAEVIGVDEPHQNGSKLVNPLTCDDCGIPQEEHTRNQLRAEQRKRAGL